MCKNEKNKIMVALPDWMIGAEFAPPRSIPSQIKYYKGFDGGTFMRTTTLIPVDELGRPQFDASQDEIQYNAETLIDGVCMESQPIRLNDYSLRESLEPRFSVEMWLPGLTQAHPDDLS